ncbi:hypothetical protein OH77DRAFT_547109 [Trametes cingulata]|nr:hypothetical protein OH77DRAFT_547109 [Trametes cingulata]
MMIAKQRSARSLRVPGLFIKNGKTPECEKRCWCTTRISASISSTLTRCITPHYYDGISLDLCLESVPRPLYDDRRRRHDELATGLRVTEASKRVETQRKRAETPQKKAQRDGRGAPAPESESSYLGSVPRAEEGNNDDSSGIGGNISKRRRLE